MKTLRSLVREKISKNEDFKNTLKDLKADLEIFDETVGYLQYFEVKIRTTFCFEIFTHYAESEESNWLCEIQTSELRYGRTFNFVIETSYGKNPAKIVGDLIINDILVNSEFAENWQDVHNLRITFSHVHVSELVAWSSNDVGIYHIEQECGEGWITAPLKPNLGSITMVVSQKIQSKTIELDIPNGRVCKPRRRARKL